jgi:G3E family GTPase
MIGGFLGAGKSTSILRLADTLSQQGLRVGLITNDQGAQLVDSTVATAGGYAVEEIAGGCFCCRFSSLKAAADRLTESSRPDVFIAEPVGSCTDLVATVSYPLRRMYGDDYEVAPLSVVLDPVRARRVLGLDPKKQFSDKVVYVYRKQMEEADAIVINKCDLLSAAELDELESAINQEYPHARVHRCSARSGDGLQAWFDDVLSSDASSRPAMQVDYQTYGEGEALLGWLNAALSVSAEPAVDGNTLLRHLAGIIHQRATEHDVEIAHLKMTLAPDGGNDLAVLNLVRSDAEVELAQELITPLRAGELVLNFRAEASPEMMKDAVSEAIAAATNETLSLRLDHVEHFRPGMPQPEHRLTSV